MLYWPLPVGIKHHRPYKINPFSAHDSPPKWCGCSPRPGAQCGNDPQVKGRLASSSIKGKDCNCTMHRLCEKKGPAVTGIYGIYWYRICLKRKLSPHNDTKSFQSALHMFSTISEQSVYMVNIIFSKTVLNDILNINIQNNLDVVRVN